MTDDRDLFGEAIPISDGGPLARAFAYPPFTVLSARDGWWQERKRQWLALGIQSELGRGANVNGGGGGCYTDIATFRQCGKNNG